MMVYIIVCEGTLGRTYVEKVTLDEAEAERLTRDSNQHDDPCHVIARSLDVGHEPEKVLIVTGGRDFRPPESVWKALDILQPERVVQGGCPSGADLFARDWCFVRKVTCETYFADFAKRGRQDGPMRNGRMSKRGLLYLELLGDHLAVLTFPGNAGTRSMTDIAIGDGHVVMSSDFVLSSMFKPPEPWG